MKIWLINPYGPVPGEGWRDYCYTLLGNALAREGHEVIWWTSNFSHHFKKFRTHGWKDASCSETFTIRYVPTTGYSKNIGFGRILRDWVFGVRTFLRGRKEEAPDVIIYSENPLTLGFAGARLARFHGAVAIYHQMDLWPELMVRTLPPQVRGVVSALLAPVFRCRRRDFRNLAAVTALAKPYLEAVLVDAPELRDRPHAVIYNGINVSMFRSAMTAPLDTGLPPKVPGEIWAVFAGSLGPSYDILTLVRAAKMLSENERHIKIIIAGDGPYAEMLSTEQKKCPSLIYLGKLSPSALASLYGKCEIGLAAYGPSSNVEVPDKFYDYTAAGLAVINSLEGEVATIIEHAGAGLKYKAGDCINLVETLLGYSRDCVSLAEARRRSWELGAMYDQSLQYSKFSKIVLAGCLR